MPSRDTNDRFADRKQDDSVPARRQYQFRQSKWFRDDVRDLSPDVAERTRAKLQQLIDDWHANVSEADFARKYELKIPKTDPSCRRLALRQVRFINKVRAYFTIVEEQQSIWLLSIGFKEGSAWQDAEIKRACQHARTIRERDHERN
jgi:hypothetical protein